jgi:hypothetical protein
MATNPFSLLADCLLAIDGVTVPVSDPVPGNHVGGLERQLAFGIPRVDAERLVPLVGRNAVVHTRRGVVLMRLRLDHVDSTRHLVFAEPARS